MLIKKVVSLLCIILLVFPSLSIANEDHEKVTHSYIIGLNEEVAEDYFIKKKLKDKKIKK
ncbi:hypothetical protein [Chengkuizengella marina]|uniref:Uncharacterized protein n=1 Tax=Chengkuizengella marina TaxID=2507566 RepID=A0A6N9Q6P1_9BACL|nr:hypothetical protein [Chengkuizengella marina]NBI30565.1 hypothetical protein [Chengkuizengella marina]